MKLTHVTLRVKDLEKSLSFYREITGLEVKMRFQAGPNQEIAFLENGETSLELVCNSGHSVAESGNGVSLGFAADSLEDTISLLREKGYETDGNIISPNPQVRFFFARDPDGYTIQFTGAHD